MNILVVSTKLLNQINISAPSMFYCSGLDQTSQLLVCKTRVHSWKFKYVRDQILVEDKKLSS